MNIIAFVYVCEDNNFIPIDGIEGNIIYYKENAFDTQVLVITDKNNCYAIDCEIEDECEAENFNDRLFLVKGNDICIGDRKIFSISRDTYFVGDKKIRDPDMIFMFDYIDL